MAFSKKQKLALLLFLRRRRRKQRSMSIQPIFKARKLFGEYHHLMPMLRQDPGKFREYLRMEPSTFDILLASCSEDLSKQRTNFRKPITPEERLVVTLRFLATGDSFRLLSLRFRMGFATVRKIVQEAVQVIWNRLHKTEMAIPDQSKWKLIADNFFTKCDFPLCLGALDGKHVKIKAPPNSGSEFCNYKGQHSLVLMAVADANYKFTVIDVGAYRSNSDGGIIHESTFYKLLMSQKLNIPEPSTIPGTELTVPFVFVADEAFPLMCNMMRPFARRDLTDEKRQFNCRLSRARSQVEYAFGILSSMWRVLLGTIEVHDEFACGIVKAVCVLHNLILNNEEDRISQLSADETDVVEITLVQTLPANRGRPSNKAIQIRDTFMAYFTSASGSLPWQHH